MTPDTVFGRAALIACVAVLAAGCGKPSASQGDKMEKIAALQEKITRLQAEAQRVQDVSEIKRLQRAYGYYVERAMWDEAADLFSTDGSIEIGLDGVYQGRERVRKYLYALGGGRSGLKEGELNEHFQLQPFVTLSEDGRAAKGRWRTLIMAGELGKNAVWGEGPYENEYVKENGVWKIGKLHWYQTFIVPYEGGWAKNKDVTGGIHVSKTLPPDKPPTERYEVWPGVYIPPFHFKNPVTGN